MEEKNIIPNIPEELTLLIRKAVMHKRTMEGHKKSYDVVKKQIDAELTRLGISGKNIYQTNSGVLVSLGKPYQKTVDPTILADLSEESEEIYDKLVEIAMSKLLDITVAEAEKDEDLKEAVVLKEVVPPMRFKFPPEEEE